jgi:hypothetical protein
MTTSNKDAAMESMTEQTNLSPKVTTKGKNYVQ